MFSLKCNSELLCSANKYAKYTILLMVYCVNVLCHEDKVSENGKKKTKNIK